MNPRKDIGFLLNGFLFVSRNKKNNKTIFIYTVVKGNNQIPDVYFCKIFFTRKKYYIFGYKIQRVIAKKGKGYIVYRFENAYFERLSKIKNK